MSLAPRVASSRSSCSGRSPVYWGLTESTHIATFVGKPFIAGQTKTSIFYHVKDPQTNEKLSFPLEMAYNSKNRGDGFKKIEGRFIPELTVFDCYVTKR